MIAMTALVVMMLILVLLDVLIMMGASVRITITIAVASDRAGTGKNSRKTELYISFQHFSRRIGKLAAERPIGQVITPLKAFSYSRHTGLRYRLPESAAHSPDIDA
jgi:hypothetical protein